VPKVPGINKIGFNNFLNETPIRPDAHMFLEKYRPEAAEEAYSFRSIEIAGGPPASYVNLTADQLANSVGQEANLDTQTVLGMTYPAPVYSYSTGGFPPNSPHTNEPYLVYINYILGQSDLPQVISNSYGDDEQTVPKSYAKRVCQSFAQLGARGTTLLVSSGDGGLGDEDPKVCITNDGKNSSTFLPEFPASCPYVTTVGATEQFEPEVAAWRPDGIGPDGKNHPYYASGSGFSYYFERPWYQDGVVDTYVENLKGLHAGLYNTSMYNRFALGLYIADKIADGRGYPDISAQGLYFALVWNQTFSSTSGTSASTPLAASIISLVNDDLIASGKAPLGFLNPWLYSKGYKGFKDVTGGNTSSCGTTGFPVTKGWDPVTGFGTPVHTLLSAQKRLLINLIDFPEVARACQILIVEGVLVLYDNHLEVLYIRREGNSKKYTYSNNNDNKTASHKNNSMWLIFEKHTHHASSFLTEAEAVSVNLLCEHCLWTL